MAMFGSIDTSASGMTAERLRMDVISNNIANVNTTRTAQGTAYRRKYVVFEPRTDMEQSASFFNTFSNELQKPGDGVRVVRIQDDDSPFKLKYDPGNPDANQQGYVNMPNVNIVAEMTDMITASRAYEANVTAINSAKSMAMKTLDIGK
ncbi:flagellar basal body rod protein FlgC [Pectinatus cerevisiiphilus]|uniref:Flagellar basal-body rod protein FlgC n=1 Tax=Pectinatus cerevisiiphilus TaxID=86956 RepID=A0A4R3KCT9_9FIRM|nr:flagellar basal body rod protein FlgC [Pectinatus cerevisiiphilus]TCS80938.1 flagellar basal-body rod protein FlgC [Pectinatus cerevisiiphilus]